MRAVAIAVMLASCRPSTPAPTPRLDNRASLGPRPAPRLLARVSPPTRAMIAQPRAAFLTATASPPSGSCEEQLWYAWRQGLEHLAVIAATLGAPPGRCAATAEHAMAAVALVMTRSDHGTVNGAWRRALAWSVAARVASSPTRARIARRNLAEAQWDTAWRSADDSAAWVSAAETFAELAGDPEAADAEAAAWVNAVVTEVRVTGGDPDRALLARALERAQALPPDGAARVRAVAGEPPRTKPVGSAHKRRAPY